MLIYLVGTFLTWSVIRRPIVNLVKRDKDIKAEAYFLFVVGGLIWPLFWVAFAVWLLLGEG